MAVFVQPGERIVIPIRSGDETLMWDTVVAEDCGGRGYWYCDTCQKSLNHNWDAAGHEEDGHTLAWICFEHGPETVTEKEPQ